MRLHPLVMPVALVAGLFLVLAGLLFAVYQIESNSHRLDKLEAENKISSVRANQKTRQGVYYLCLNVGHKNIECRALSQGEVSNKLKPTLRRGPQGATGAQGDRGPQGPQGIMGLPGMTGPQGLRGLRGLPGPKGATGSQGPQGTTGERGATGSKGATGAKGDTGAQGPRGEQGPPGTGGCPGHWVLERNPPLGLVYICVR